MRFTLVLLTLMFVAQTSIAEAGHLVFLAIGNDYRLPGASQSTKLLAVELSNRGADGFVLAPKKYASNTAARIARGEGMMPTMASQVTQMPSEVSATRLNESGGNGWIAARVKQE